MTTNEHTGSTHPAGGAAGQQGQQGRIGDGEVRWSMRIPAAELARFAVLGGLCEPDERDPYGGVVLECDGSQRHWSAGTTELAVRCEGGPTTTVGRVVLPRRVLPVAPALADPDGGVDVVVHEERGVPTRVTVEGAGGRVSVPLPAQLHPVHARFVQHRDEGADGAPCAEVVLPASALQRLVHMVRVSPVAPPPGKGAEAISGPLPWLVLDEGELRLELEWDGIGSFEYSLRGEGTGIARCLVAPNDLDRALHGMSDDVVVQVPLGPGGFVTVTEPGVSVALLNPIADPATHLVDELVTILRAVYADDLDEQIDAEGGRVLSVVHDGVTVTLAVQESDLLVLRLQAVVLEGVRGTLGLHRELNDLNLGLDLVRLTWLDRRVDVVADLALDACDPAVVLTALERVASVVRDLAPLVQAVHGGRAPVAPVVIGD